MICFQKCILRLKLHQNKCAHILSTYTIKALPICTLKKAFGECIDPINLDLGKPSSISVSNKFHCALIKKMMAWHASFKKLMLMYKICLKNFAIKRKN